MAPREMSVGKHTDWSTVLVVCSPESLTYTQRESLKLKKIIQVYNIFFCVMHISSKCGRVLYDW